MQVDRETEVVAWEEDPDGGRLTIRASDGAAWEVAPFAPEVEGLGPGAKLDAAKREALDFAAQRKAIAKEALRLLDRRFYSRRRLRLRLIQKGHSAEAVDAVVDQLVGQGLLDDRRFAQAFCRDQLARRPVGRRWLRSGLRDQGVAEEAIEEALAEVLPPEQEEEACRRALASRRYSLEDEKNRARAMRFLASRGFGASLSRKVVFAEADRIRASHREGE